MTESEQGPSNPSPPSSLGGARAPRLPRLLRLRFADLITRESSITEGSALLIVAFLISAALGVVRQVLFNAQFGTGVEANAYYAAFRLPDTIATLIAGGTLANAMVPVLLGVARAEGEAAMHRLANLTLTVLLTTAAITIALGALLAPQFVHFLLAPGFDAETSRLTIILTRLMLFELALAVATGVAEALLISRNQFVLPAISIAIRNITLISGIVAAMFVPGVGIYGPAVGAVGDAVLQVAVLAPGLWRNRWRYRPVWNLADRRLREVIRLLIPNGLSGAVNYAGGIVDTAYASLSRSLMGLSAVHNAFLVIGLPIRLLGIAIGQAAFPRVAAYAAAARWRDMRRIMLQTLGVTLLLGFLATLAILVLGRPTIALILERGRFDAAAGSLTYTLLAAYAVALPAYIATEVLTRGLIALHDTRTPLLTNTLQLAGRIALIPPLLERFDVLAIPVAFAVTSALETVVLGWALMFKLRRRISANREI